MKANRAARNNQEGITPVLGTLLMLPIVMMIIAAMMLWAQDLIDQMSKFQEDLQDQMYSGDITLTAPDDNILYEEDFEKEGLDAYTYNLPWEQNPPGIAAHSDITYFSHVYSLELTTSGGSANIIKGFGGRASSDEVSLEVAFTIDETVPISNEHYKEFKIYEYDGSFDQNIGTIRIYANGVLYNIPDGIAPPGNQIVNLGSALYADDFGWHTIKFVVDLSHEGSGDPEYVSLEFNGKEYDLSGDLLESGSSNVPVALYFEISSYDNGGANAVSYIDDIVIRDLGMGDNSDGGGGGSDTTPPTPNPSTWSTVPTATGTTSITMTATTANDPSGPVQYYFDETTGNPGGSDSSWQLSPTYTDNGLTASTTYTYRVRTKDAIPNTGSYSTSQSATTTAAADTTPPTPNPSTWSTVPTATGTTSITMTATTANDPSGPVQYYFDETTGNPGGSDSSWQLSPTYTDNGLTASTTYTYRVRTKDAIPNTGSYSTSQSATTTAAADTTPPTPNPSTWSTVPTATGTTSITMTATTANDPSGPVQYYFDETTGNPGGSDSSWQLSPTYTDNGLTASTTYTYRVRTKDAIPNTGSYSTSQSATTTAAADTTPPTPNPSTWSTVPTATGTTSITMTATTANDPSGPVQYYFDETTGNPGGSDSSWQLSPTYTDNGLTASTTYTYRVRTKDAIPNTGSYSTSQSATTTAAADTTPPTPNPSTWSTVPTATGTTSITMTATTANDPSGPVQYYFDETTGNPGGSDSSWQLSPTYTDNGLTASTTYTYRVRTKDAIPNTGSYSTSQSATTTAAADTTPPTPNPSTWSTVPTATGTTSITMTATTANDPSGPVQYYFDETTGNPGGSDSSWQLSPTYTDNGLTASTTYTYRVRTKDAIPNTGSYSTSQSATTTAAADTTPPTPNPSTWSTVPTATGTTSITMTATTANDPSGPVQYYFDETTGNPGGSDSSWQLSPTYTDNGLTASTTYTYRVRTKDAIPNTGSYSTSQSATTDTPATPHLEITPSSGQYDFGTVLEGEKPNPTGTFTITNDGDAGTILTYTITESESWIVSVSPSSGNLNFGQSQIITVQIATRGMTTGVHNGNLNIDTNNNDETFTVIVDVSPWEVPTGGSWSSEWNGNIIDIQDDNCGTGISSDPWTNYLFNHWTDWATFNFDTDEKAEKVSICIENSPAKIVSMEIRIHYWDPDLFGGIWRTYSEVRAAGNMPPVYVEFDFGFIGIPDTEVDRVELRFLLDRNLGEDPKYGEIWAVRCYTP